jgi:uncharacterized protein YdhG (YjbR/CyaY superfamily)
MEYFAELDPRSRAAFERVHEVAMKVAPDAEEGVSYSVAALLYKGKPLLGFKAAKDHLSVFPFSPQAIDAVRGRLGGFSVSKGTVRFTPEHPLPEDVVHDLVTARRIEIDG